MSSQNTDTLRFVGWRKLKMNSFFVLVPILADRTLIILYHIDFESFILESDANKTYFLLSDEMIKTTGAFVQKIF